MRCLRLKLFNNNNNNNNNNNDDDNNNNNNNNNDNNDNNNDIKASISTKWLFNWPLKTTLQCLKTNDGDIRRLKSGAWAI